MHPPENLHPPLKISPTNRLFVLNFASLDKKHPLIPDVFLCNFSEVPRFELPESRNWQSNNQKIQANQLSGWCLQNKSLKDADNKHFEAFFIPGISIFLRINSVFKLV